MNTGESKAPRRAKRSHGGDRLVRDISHDHEDDFTMRMIAFVQKINRWQMAIAEAELREEAKQYWPAQ